MNGPGLNGRFLVVWAGQTVSALGSVLSGIGVAVYVYVETGDATWLGLLAAMAALPYVLVSPLLDLTDRYRRRTVLIAADCFAVLAPAVALGLAIAGRLEVWHLVVAGFLGGVGTAFQIPAFQAAIPALVDADVLDRANGLVQVGQALGLVLGPMLATPLVAWWGIEAVLLADLVTFLVAVSATTAVRFDDAPGSTASVDDDGTWAGFLSWLRGAGRPFVVLLAVMALVNFMFAWFNVAVVVVATGAGDVARVGVVIGVAGAAMLVGSIVVARRGVGEDRLATVAVGLALCGTGFAVAALRPSLLLLVVGVAGAVVAAPFVNAAVSTVFHEHVPASMYGRMFGLRSSLGRALEPVGSVVAGVAVAHVAEPALAPGGSLASSVGAVLGTGPGRGAALVLLAVGVTLAATGLGLAGSRTRAAFRTEPAAGAPSDAAVRSPGGAEVDVSSESEVGHPLTSTPHG